MHAEHAELPKRLGEIGVGDDSFVPPVPDVGGDLLLDVVAHGVAQEDLLVGQK